ncbi:hypothetical protein LTR86_002916 [Recurvomyces mirabilis]|nr:hypothetical protein LTR86_002916 [Recurvomyces mirabilis]
MPALEPLEDPMLDMTAGFDAEYWDPAILSTTNWLDALWDSSLDAEAAIESFVVPPGNAALNYIQVPSASTPHGGPSITSGETGTSPATQEEQTPGEYYVDGQPARLPRTKRRRMTSSVEDSLPGELLSLQWQPHDSWTQPDGIELSDQDYASVMTTFEQLCTVGIGGKPAFRGEAPSKRLLMYLLVAYWEGFDTILPVVHRSSTLRQEDAYTTIALCAVGAAHADAPLHVVMSMHEFLSRAMEQLAIYSIPAQMQASTIHARLILYMLNAYLPGDADGNAARLRPSIRSIYQDAEQGYQSCVRSCATHMLSWELWLQKEQWLRLAHAAWLLDSMHTSHIQKDPEFSLQSNGLPLPCHESVWQAASADRWKAIYKQPASSPSLLQSLQGLYVEKRLPQETGEFARVLVIHGLYHRLWEVERYLSNPLSSWEPTATRQASADILPKEPIWLPAVPMYAKWQNSTCDALDVLHWQANATIMQASGLEHPTVLHLHFARVVLLAPCEHIVRFARTLAHLNEPALGTSADGDQRLVRRWAVQHQYKARLAAVHAGVVLWHVRRYSADAFYESPCVALATLTLWAFGTFAERRAPQRASRRQSPAPTTRLNTHALGTLSESSKEVEAPCDIILLDRPTDDELVQQFIRDGHAMQAHIGGVGDLYASAGPRRVLVQGSKLLGSLKRWGVAAEWRELLDGLAGTLQTQ